jgi:hypothetical protein
VDLHHRRAPGLAARQAAAKCPRIVVERQKSKKGCELVGVAIWDSQEPEGDRPALYHAGSLLGPIAGGQGRARRLEEIVAEECDCDNCCGTPTRLDLKFSIANKTATLISEGEELMLGGEGDARQLPDQELPVAPERHLRRLARDVDWAPSAVVKP